MGFWQIWVNRHIQPGWSAFDPAQNQMLHRIKAADAVFKGALHPGLNIHDPECFQQSQNLNELALALFTHTGLHKSTQDDEGFRQVPVSQRCGLIKRVGLLLDQRQLMQRVIDVILLLPRPRVTGDDLSPAGNHHLMHIAPHQNLLMTVGSRNRIIVAAAPHERQRTHTNRLLVAGVMTCWMTTAQIQDMKEKKVMFENIK